MAHEFKMTRRVEFWETDMAGIVHFSNFFRFMESAEHAFFRSLGFSIHQQFDGRLIGWPRVDASCQFKHPLGFEDEVEIHLIVREIKSKSITYTFRFYKQEGGRRLDVACGGCTTVCAALGGEGDEIRAVPIPEAITGKIETAPE